MSVVLHKYRRFYDKLLVWKEQKKRKVILELAAKRDVIRAEDVAPFDISPAYVQDLARDGYLDRVGRGLFSLPNYRFTENHSLVEAARHAPHAVVCLLSALQFHGIGTQLPHALWLAIPNKARVPKLSSVPIQPVRMSPASLNAGVDTHALEGVPVRIFSAGRRFRNLGLTWAGTRNST